MGDVINESDVADEISPKERALTNSVIINHIFKKLKYSDWINFRLVRRAWKDETLGVWRNSVWLHIVEQIALEMFGKGIRFEEFYNLFYDNEDNIETFKLLEHPFRQCKMGHLVTINLPIRVRGGENPHQDLFFELCGPHINSLTLDTSYYYKDKLVEGLQSIFRTCPLLQSLDFFSSEKQQDDPNENKEALESEENAVVAAISPTAKYLEKFKFHSSSINSTESERILELMPNLKSLCVVGDNLGIFGGLVRPNPKGNFIQLEKLETVDFGNPTNVEAFSSLRRYTEMFPHCLKHINLYYEILSVRRAPEDFYFSIGNCKNLESLDLWVFCQRGQNHADSSWFIDLADIEFPQLTKFSLRFHHSTSEMKFDFGTLCKMPKLKELSIEGCFSFDDRRNINGAEDWLYAGPRHIFGGAAFAPVDLNPRFPLPLQHLETFTYGNLNLETFDLQLFGEWFPALKNLNASMNVNSVNVALDTFLNLERVGLGDSSFISVKELCDAKLKRSEVQFTIRSTLFGKVDVLKRENGQVTLKEAGNREVVYLNE